MKNGGNSMQDIFSHFGIISDVYEVIGEYIVNVENQLIKIRITRNIKGKYFFTTSHYNHRPDLASSYNSSINGYNTKEEAWYQALVQLTSWFKEGYIGVWKENINY